MRASISDHTPPTADCGPLLGVLDQAVEALRRHDVSFLMIGGIASSVWGRDRGTTDIDIFVRPESIDTALQALESAGFETSMEFEHWLYKGRREGITVDVIFRASRDILIDDEMLRRSSVLPFHGRRLPIAPPEDLLVMKAVAAGEDTARYWYDALGILARSELDWSYLVARARQHGARRVLSLLLFASSIDLVVPAEPVQLLWSFVSEGGRIDA